MRIILKFFAGILALVLTVASGFIKFVFCICATLCTIISILAGICAVILFIDGNYQMLVHTLIGGFLFSPYGIQAVAATIIAFIDAGRDALVSFVATPR